MYERTYFKFTYEQKSIKRKITTRRREEFLKTVIWIFNGDRSSQENFKDVFPKFINCFNQCVLPKLVTNKHTNTKTNKGWVTLGIRISSVKKRELYLLAKQSNDPVLLGYVKRYKKVLKKYVTLLS